MPSSKTCQRCGAELSESDARGLCPQCLLQVALETNTTAGPRGAPGTPDEDATESYVGGVDGPRPGRKTADLPQPGERFGHYQLHGMLGRGGMGAVFEAEDLESGRRVALKLLGHAIDSREARNRFFREGRLAASINHPNSVYVYGTEEIDDTPAISMEYIAGGTLQDRVREKGPLPPTEAVDVILQVIDGLEAAAAVGVLHRDVKPSNCFADADGTVKVGDFGLSISTEVRGDSHLTAPGSFLGTPAFSSPEQLRGDELDIRSDIYAVGVTLFYLLTGKTPYEADNLVKLLATVLERPAPSPAKFRPEIPSGLARVVMRCLAKQPSDRFRNYDELRKALIPYNSTAPTPATLALRSAAGVFDHVVLTIAGLGMLFAWLGDLSAMADPARAYAAVQSRGYLVLVLVMLLVQILYFALPEGLWGASLAKAIFRLRVVDRGRSRLGVPRALVRTMLYVAVPSSYYWIAWLLTGRPVVYDQQSSFAIAVPWSSLVMWALLFSTARRRNGYAGLHDLATGARVILRPARAMRPSLDITEQPLPDATGKQMIGAYHVLGPVAGDESGEFLLGYDTRLLRRVWIRRLPADSPPVAAGQRNLGRIGRLRWIQGQRSGDECWDAYEAPSGEPLLAVIRRPQPWAAVRFWLLDLAEELAASQREGALPEVLALNRLWVTTAGRVKLLDFPAPGTVATSFTSGDMPTAHSAAALLWQVAVSALDGRPASVNEVEPGSALCKVPLAAHELLRRLPEIAPAEAARRLESLVRGTPAVTRLRRLAMVGATAWFPFLVAAMATLGLILSSQIQKQNPEIAELHYCLISLEDLRDSPPAAPELKARHNEQVRDMETYIAGRFRATVDDRRLWNGVYGQTIPPQMRAIAEQLVKEHPAPSPAEFEKAKSKIQPMLKNIDDMARPENLPLGLLVSFQLAFAWLMFVAIPSMVAALVFRRGLIMRMFGVDFVTRSGARASRLRMLWRSMICHSPIILPVLAAFFLAVAESLLRSSIPSSSAVVVAVVFGGLLLMFAAAMLPPRRGLGDRLAGTYPLPA